MQSRADKEPSDPSTTDVTRSIGADGSLLPPAERRVKWRFGGPGL
jgi:hypothetical protein